MSGSRTLIPVAHALAMLDSYTEALRAIDPNLTFVIEDLRDSRDRFAQLWASLRGKTYSLTGAVQDARTYLRVHIEEYVTWETELNAYLDKPE